MWTWNGKTLGLLRFTALTRKAREYDHIRKGLRKTFRKEIIICVTQQSQNVDQEEFDSLTQQNSEDNWPILKVS